MEALPFFKALYAGKLPKPAIISFLRSLAIIHAVLEREHSAVSNHQVSHLLSLATPKVPLLIADIEALDAQNTPSVTRAIRGALEYGAEVLTQAEDPLNLVGAFYVLEGSQNGGVALKEAYSSCLGVREDQLSYFGCYGGNTASHWKIIGTALDALELGIGQRQKIARAAVRCFEQLKSICAALYPYANDDLKHHVTTINFEAGDHVMPQNPHEIGLALRAGRIAWQKYPYLEFRFGERGKRFTSSDSCWLVALTRMPIETATKNLEWLRIVLASRGIPTVILEAHLRSILGALANEFPEQIEMRSKFDPFLSSLEAERQARGDADALSRLVGKFDRRFSRCGGFLVPSAAQLIASAWGDKRSGIDNALASVADWFTDPKRFSSDWVVNAHELMKELDRAVGASC